ncbi:MAG TPA: hypothetical protein VMV10_26305 [Pirellulales bacterium]|nr:hypothetical protein [Pirellulales bacterium]
MSLLLQIRNRLDATAARVKTLEQALIDNPGYPSIAANLESLVRIQSQLESQFLAAAAEAGIEVCRYRAFNDFESNRTADAFNAVVGFQRLVSVVYGALKHGIKQRATIPTAIAKETAFGFGYAFAGSIGVVLTIRADRNLFGESFLDDSVNTIFRMAKAESSKEIVEFADQLGPGPINALYQWAEDNATHGLGADIEWRRGTEVRNSLLVQRQELWKLKEAIKTTSSERTEAVCIEGILQAADASKLRFKLRPDGLREIKGTVETGVIDERHTVGLPRRYIADLLKTTRTRYSTGEVKSKYHLLRLEKLGNSSLE